MTREYNVIEAKLTSRDRKCVIGPLWQYDYGQILRITGIDLPDAYEVHFSNNPRGEAKRMPGNADGVEIPSEYLESGSNVFAWFYVHNGIYDGSTEYQIEIQVRRRAKPTDYQPEDENDEKIIEKLIEGQVKSALQVVSDSVKSNADRIEELDQKIDTIQYDEVTLSIEDGVLSVNTVDTPLEDDPRPITSGAVYNEFSKAVALLKTI